MQQGIDVTNINKEQNLSETMINYDMIMTAMDSWESDQVLPLAVIVKSGTDVAKIICDVDSLEKSGWDLACINGAFLEEMTGSRKVKKVEGLNPKDTEFALEMIDALALKTEQTEDEIEFLSKWVINEWKKLDDKS